MIKRQSNMYYKRVHIFQIQIVIIFLFFSNSALAQKIPEYEKKHSVDTITGKVYWNKHVPFGIKVISITNDDEVELFSKQQKQLYFDTEGLNTIQSPWLINSETKNYIYPQTEVKFNIYADGLAPGTNPQFLIAPMYIHENSIFYGKNLKIKLTSNDETSGVKELIYSINNSPYNVYNDTISFEKEGIYTIKYLAVDNVGNVEGVNIKEFYVDTTAPATYHSVIGIDLENSIISKSSKIILEANDKLTGLKKTLYSIDDGVELLYKGGIIPIANLKNGNHSIKYYSIDNVKNVEKKKELKFYLDKAAPILSSDVLGDRYVVNNQIYFSGRTKLKLTAVDNKSGVKDIMYSINKEPFMAYTEPFYLPSREGLHTVEYYALDNTGNTTGQEEGTTVKGEEFKHKVIKKIFTDLVGPSLNHKFSGVFYSTRDTVFISTNTKINLIAFDGESGLQYISYSIDEHKEEKRYNQPFTISEKGLHEIEFFAYDNVNNRNKSSFNCFVDNESPIIYHTFSIPPIGKKEIEAKDSTLSQNVLDVYPSYVNVYLAAKDMTIGSDRIYYSLNKSELKLYRNKIEGFIKNNVNTIKIVAVDKLENKGELELSFYISE